MSEQQHNPKYVEALKRGKVDYSTIPWSWIGMLAQAMMEGAEKYGRFNYRQDNIEARTYIAAICRHLFGDPSTGSLGWVNGEDIDAESGLPHLVKIMACCGLVLDAEQFGKLIDNRLTTESKTPPSATIMSDKDRDDMIDAYRGIAEAMKTFPSRPLCAPAPAVPEHPLEKELDASEFEIKADGFVTIHPQPFKLDPRKTLTERLLEDIGRANHGLTVRDIHRNIADPGWYVEFDDVEPNGLASWVTIQGPFANDSEALEYAQRNPDNLPGLRSIFNI